MRAISLGYEGWCDQRDGLARIIYRSQGVKVDDPPRRGQPQSKPDAATNFRQFVREHNAIFKAQQAARRRDKPPGAR